MESILLSIKKLLGITEEYTIFDSDLIMHINSVFGILTQIGIGPAEGFSISDEFAKWEDFTENKISLEPIKSYMALKVKLLFDPPTSSAVIDSINKLIAELEWRIFVIGDSPQVESGGESQNGT